MGVQFMQTLYVPSAHYKLVRANNHFVYLQDAMNVIRHTDFAHISHEYDSKGSRNFWKFESLADGIEGQISPVIGDILFNLNSCLDHIYNEMVKTFGKPESASDYWPFASSHENWMKRRVEINARVGAEYLTALERYQFYRDSFEDPTSEPLICLHSLSKLDKHKRFPLTGLVDGAAVLIKPKDSSIPYHFLYVGRVNRNAVLAILDGDEVNVKPEIHMDIAFDEFVEGHGKFPTSQSVTDIMGQILIRVSIICRELGVSPIK